MWAAATHGRRSRLAARGKEQLLEAAAAVIAERGLDGARFADIARASGSAISSLQYYFGSREDLLVQTVEHMAQGDLERLRAIEAQESDPGRRLAALTTLYVDASAEQRARRFWFEIGRAAVRNDELRAFFHRRQEEWTSAFIKVIAEAPGRGPLTGLIPEDAALQLVALIDGLDVPRLLTEPPMSPSRVAEIASSYAESLLGPDEERSSTQAS